MEVLNISFLSQAVPDYHKIVTRPMDLQSVRENLRQKKYQSREEFLSDINQIVENSTLYNGKKISVYFLITIQCRFCNMSNKVGSFVAQCLHTAHYQELVYIRFEAFSMTECSEVLLGDHPCQ